MLYQKNESFTCELALIKFSLLGKYKARKNTATWKRHILRKKGLKVKKHFTIHD